MPLLAVAYDWRRLFTSLVLFLGVALALPVCESAEVNAQSRTKLTLLDQVPKLGTSELVVGDSLPAETQVIVFVEDVVSDETKSDFSTLPNLGTSHSELAQRIRSGAGMTMRLQGGGQTPESFGTTGSSGKIYYLLARTGEGELYESYVNAGDSGFQPGFDAVQSGVMKMGPVPEKHRDTLRAALESAFSTGNSGGGDPKPGSEKRGGPPATDNGRDAGDTSYIQWVFGFLPGGGPWNAVLVFLFGGIFGGFGVWIFMRNKFRRAKGKFKKMRRKANRFKRSLEEEKKKPKKNKKRIGNEVNKLEREKNRRINELEEKVKKRDRKIEDLRRRLERLKSERKDKAESHRRRRSTGRGQKANSSDQRSKSQDPSHQTPGDGLVEGIGRAFVKWCDEAGAAMVDRHTMFAKTLKDHIPQADLRRIFREKNAAGVVFAEDAQDAVEYWLVRADGRDFLLPQPQRSGFREVDKCFEVEKSSPDELQEFLPAELQSQGGKYKLQSEGMLA